MNLFLSIGLVLAMLACVALIPLGLPGLWVIVVITLTLVLAGHVGWGIGIGVAVAAAVAELLELLVLGRFGRAFGGSRRAFWGAVLGGLLGLFVGVPVPVVGSVVTAFVGTFLGAGLVTWVETRSLQRSARVGWGVLLARTVAVALKVAVAFGVIGVVGLAILL
jgi:uncharacterized protein